MSQSDKPNVFQNENSAPCFTTLEINYIFQCLRRKSLSSSNTADYPDQVHLWHTFSYFKWNIEKQTKVFDIYIYIYTYTHIYIYMELYWLLFMYKYIKNIWYFRTIYNRKIILTLSNDVGFVFFTGMSMKNDVLWDVTPCGSCKNRRKTCFDYWLVITLFLARRFLPP
jgi:hypothetical protein